NRSNGNMYFYLYNWQAKQSSSQSVKDIPVGQWVKLDADYTCAGNGTGHVAFSQDGTLLFDLPNVQTRYATGDCRLNLSNYSDAVSPSPSTIYLDDVSISSSSGGTVTPPPPAPGPTPLGITTTSLPAGSTGTSYSATVA